MNSLERLYNAAVVPVVVLDDAADAVPTAKALLAGGVDVMEITFRTAAAADSIEAVAKECPDMLVGAGTVITLEQCKNAVARGAKFIVSPGLNPTTVKHCQEIGIPVCPGTANPSDIEVALSLGLKTVKFFPAEAAGGLKYIKSIAAPYVDMKFMPTGGISPSNVKEYLSQPNVIACGGSWLCPAGDVNEGNWAAITQRAQECMALVREVRS